MHFVSVYYIAQAQLVGTALLIVFIMHNMTKKKKKISTKDFVRFKKRQNTFSLRQKVF